MVNPVHVLIHHLPDGVKHAVDAASFGTVAVTMAGLMPSLAAGASLVWSSLRIYEWFEKRRLIREGKLPSNGPEQNH